MDRVANILELIASFSDEEKAAFEKGLGELKSPATKPPPSSECKPVLPSSPRSTRCPHCANSALQRRGGYRGRYRYKCLSCLKTFNELTDTPLAGVRDADKMRLFAAQMAEGGVSLRKSAAALDISLATAFNWRHRIIQGYSVAQSRKLVGIAEADETFFRYSKKGDKTVHKRRRAHGRGAKALKAGVSDEQVPVIVGCDRQGEMFLGTAGRGRISLKDIEHVLGNRIDANATLCTDSHSSFRAFAKTNRIKYQPVNASKGERVVKKFFHIQHANNAHARLKNWMIRFRGVSTKHLDNYAQWFGLMEETKPLDNGTEKFAERSVAQRRRKNAQSN